MLITKDLVVQNYYNRFDKTKQYKNVMIRSGYPTQGGEMNDLQAIQDYERSLLLNLLYEEGSVAKGGGCKFDTLDEYGGGTIAQLEKTVLNSFGYLHEVDYTELIIGFDETIVVGILLEWEEIGPSIDPELVDQAENTPNFSEPGAFRLKVWGNWARETEYDETNDHSKFFPIHEFNHGSLVNPVVSPDTTLIDLLARYDRSANGSYVVDKANVRFEKNDAVNEKHVMVLEKCYVHVYGYEVFFNYDTKFEVDYALATQYFGNDSQTFTGDGFYNTRWAPISSVTEIDGTKQITVELTRGPSMSGADTLSPGNVSSLVKVWQSAGQTGDSEVVYSIGTHCQLISLEDKIDWIDTGDPATQPAPGELYYVTYEYGATVEPANFTAGDSQLDIRGFLNGTTFRVDYNFFLPRIDRVVILRDGTIKVIKGQPLIHPQPPSYTEGLSLCTVYCQFGKNPVVNMDYYVAYHMSDLKRMDQQLEYVVYNLGRLALLERARREDPTTVMTNMFVDSFENNAKRDAGFLNNAQTFKGKLTAGIEWETVILSQTTPFALDYTTSVILNQPIHTGDRNINEWTWTSPPPAEILINPEEYTWLNDKSYQKVFNTIVTQDSKTIRTAERKLQSQMAVDNAPQWHIHNEVTYDVTDSSEESVVESEIMVDDPAFIPAITISVTANIFEVGEDIIVYFDDVEAATFIADGDGNISGTFTVPSNILSGAKPVKVVGQNSGVEGTTTFIATPLEQVTKETVTTTTNVTTVREITDIYYNIPNDPLAQTFELDKDRFVTAVGIRFTAAPTTFVDVFITETQVGFPDRNKAVAKARKRPADCIVNGEGEENYTWFTFDKPIFLTRDTYYCIVVESTDRDGKISVCKLGEYNNLSKWQTTQAYDDGVLLTSANGVTWTPLQAEDMTFKLEAATFSTTKEIQIGSIINLTTDTSLGSATDLVFTTQANIYPGTAVTYTVKFLDELVGGIVKELFINPDVPLSFLEYAGRVSFHAYISTTDTDISPILSGNVQVSFGKVTYPSQYVSRRWELTGADLKVNLDEYCPTQATEIHMYCQDSSLTHDRTEGYEIGEATGGGGLSALFDDVSSQASSACAVKNSASYCYVGKDMGNNNEQRVTGFRIYGSSDLGFRNTPSPVTITAILVGSNDSDPLTAYELGRVSNTDEAGRILARLYDIVNPQPYRYYWIKLEGGDATDDYNWYIAEIEFFVMQWVEMTAQPNPKALGNDWVDKQYVYTGLDDSSHTRLKIDLVRNESFEMESEADRPTVKNLRAYTYG